MNADNYIAKRLDNQIDWYDKKSKKNKLAFQLIRIIEILLASSIPFISSIHTPFPNTFKLITGIIGVIISILTGIIALCKFQENWINYRNITEALKHEKFIYQYSSKNNGSDTSDNFIKKCESLISKENSNWNLNSSINSQKNITS